MLVSAPRPTRSCRPTERAFLERLAPAFTELADGAEDTLYVDGAARLFREYALPGHPAAQPLMEMLERRVALLGVMREALVLAATCGSASAGRTSFPRCAPLAVVAAAYGLPRRSLGTVSVIGPTRDGLRDGDRVGPRRRAPALALRRRRLRRVMPDRDYYDVLGVSRDADEPRSRRPSAAWRASCTPTSTTTTPRPRRSSRRRPRPTRCSRTPSGARIYDRYGHEGLRSGGYEPSFEGFGSFADIFDAFFGGGMGDAFGSAAGARAPCRAATWRSRPRSRSPRSRPGRRPRSPTTWSRPARAATATAPSRARRSRRAGAATARASSRPSPARRSARSCARSACDVCGGEGKVAQTPCTECCGARAGREAAQARGRRPGRDRGRPAHPARRPRPRGGGGRPAGRPLRAGAHARRTSGSCATAPIS